jgi:NAD(P)-dependent dehydrogenase (short-subunit alcohol dehydrogenase family)
MASKTVLITGASSGIGRATALLFQQQGWNVAATMRTPSKAGELASLPQVICLPLDVTQPESIQAALEQMLQQFGKLDVVINNAGYALLGPFETASTEQVERQFATNVFGLMAVTRAVLPLFRSAQGGTIINVASVGGQMTFPLYSLYHATKWSVEGFSESLQYEVRPWNIRIKIVEPGPIKTDFYDRSAEQSQSSDLKVYDHWANQVMERLMKVGEEGSPPEVVAKGIYRAATDQSWRLRYPAGGNAGALLLMRRLLPAGAYRALIHRLLIR